MTIQDPIADMLTRIRNAQLVKNKEVIFSLSKVKKAILVILKEEGYIEGFEVISNDNGKSDLKVYLKYYQKSPVIEMIKRVSRPGLRRYSASDKLPRIYNGLGVAIISTSKGIMTGNEAKKRKLGGEIICEVM